MINKIRNIDILRAVEIHHKEYDKLQDIMESTNKVVLLYGPRACGKKYAVTQFCRENWQVPYFCANIRTEEDIFGTMFEGKYQKSQLFMAYLNGEVLVVGNVASAQLLALLSKIQNSKSVKFPCGRVEKGKGFRIVYVVERENINIEGLQNEFAAIRFDYDPVIEAKICQDLDLYNFLNAVRNIGNLCVTTNTFKKLYDMSKIAPFTKSDVVKSLLCGDNSTSTIAEIVKKAGGKLKTNAYMKELASFIKAC